MKYKGHLYASSILLTTLLSSSVQAEVVSALSYEEVGDFINDYSTKNKYSRDELVEIFARTKVKQSIVKQSKNQPEVKLTWGSYKKRVITDAKIDKGKEFLENNKEILQRAEDTYGVPSEIITSIIGIESFYGKYKGSKKAIDAISTLSFEGSDRRQSFFKKELGSFLDHCYDNKLDPLTQKSSWAGAFGYPQFIPSSIKAYAVDFDNDGVIDLVNSLEDSIGSVGNYLNENGWIKDNYIAEQVYSVNFDKIKESRFKLDYEVKKLQNDGVKFYRGMRPTKKVKLFSLIDNDETQYWAGYNNFHTITRYNRSNLYAMAVFQLANELKGDEVL